jgi:hypothetical protein
MEHADANSSPSQYRQPVATSVRLVNPEFGYGKAKLIAPTNRGYLYIAAAVQPGATPLVLPSRRRAALLGDLNRAASQLRSIENVAAVDLFGAMVMPPTARFSAYLQERRGSLRVATFDVAMLIQTSSVPAISRLQSHDRVVALIEMLRQRAQRVYVMPAHNVRRIGDVDTARDGLFLFNHFVADDRDVMLELWDYLAGWYAAETGLRTSVALMPLSTKPDDFTIVNWARWDVHPLRHFWRDNSGTTWRSPSAGLEVGYLRSVAIDPEQPDVVVVSASSGPHSAYVAGRSDGRLYRRISPERWERVRDGWPEPPSTIAPLLCAGATLGELWAADERGVHRSDDGGKSWRQVARYTTSPQHLRGLALVQ